jgi:hypothetical protein
MILGVGICLVALGMVRKFFITINGPLLFIFLAILEVTSDTPTTSAPI